MDISTNVSMAEWLKRVIRNHLGFLRVGSNPTTDVLGLTHFNDLFLKLRDIQKTKSESIVIRQQNI